MPRSSVRESRPKQRGGAEGMDVDGGDMDHGEYVYCNDHVIM